MTLFLITLTVFGLVLLGMSVGVIFGNRRDSWYLWGPVARRRNTCSDDL